MPAKPKRGARGRQRRSSDDDAHPLPCDTLQRNGRQRARGRAGLSALAASDDSGSDADAAGVPARSLSRAAAGTNGCNAPGSSARQRDSSKKCKTKQTSKSNHRNKRMNATYTSNGCWMSKRNAGRDGEAQGDQDNQIIPQRRPTAQTAQSRKIGGKRGQRQGKRTTPKTAART